MVRISEVGAGLAVAALVAAVGFAQFRFNSVVTANGTTCATESIAALEDLDASNVAMSGLGAMTPAQVCQFYGDRIAILDRLRTCSRAREAQGWSAESNYYQKVRQGRCG